MLHKDPTQKPDTFYDRPERLPPDVIAAQAQAVHAHTFACNVLDIFPEPVFILNDHRQIVFVNRQAWSTFPRPTPDVLGRRLGEVVECVHAAAPPHGCGTSRQCSACGVAHVLKHVHDVHDGASEECRLTCRRPDGTREVLEFRVWGAPLYLKPHLFTVVSLKDSADSGRLRLLEHLLFGDVLHASGRLRDLLAAVGELDSRREVRATSARAAGLAGELVTRIEAQRAITRAEQGELAPTFENVPVASFLRTAMRAYEHHAVAAGKTLRLEAVVPSRVTVHTDRALLGRVLEILLTNALEATPRRGVVRVGFDAAPAPTFRVANRGVIPAAVQSQVFQRSRSTKPGVSRGVGTYAARLLVENYLKGSISFRSSRSQGTVFTVVLP